MTRQHHANEIAELLLARLDAAPAQATRRLLRPQVRWVAQQLDEELAADLGVLDLVERCRDDHLSRLGADDGLAVLSVSWEDVVVRAERLLSARRTPSCPRCGARLGRKAHRCRRCGLLHPGSGTRGASN